MCSVYRLKKITLALQGYIKNPCGWGGLSTPSAPTLPPQTYLSGKKNRSQKIGQKKVLPPPLEPIRFFLGKNGKIEIVRKNEDFIKIVKKENEV